jgi:hypothetical protein
VRHDGEFVLTKNGNKDFGEISPEIAQVIRRQPGKIRFRIGEQAGKPGDYGKDTWNVKTASKNSAQMVTETPVIWSRMWPKAILPSMMALVNGLDYTKKR